MGGSLVCSRGERGAESNGLPRGDEQSLSRGTSTRVCLIRLLFHGWLTIHSLIPTVRQRRKAMISTTMSNG